MIYKIIYRLARFFEKGESVFFLLCFLLLFCSVSMKFFDQHSDIILKILIGGIFVSLSSGTFFKLFFNMCKKNLLLQMKKYQLDHVGILIGIDQAALCWIKQQEYEDIQSKAKLLNLIVPFFRMDDARHKKDLFFELLSKEDLSAENRGNLILRFHEAYLDTSLIKDNQLIEMFNQFLDTNKKFEFAQPTVGMAKLHCIYPSFIRKKLEDKGLHHELMYSFLGKGYSKYNTPTGWLLNSQTFEQFYTTYVGQGVRLRKILLNKMSHFFGLESYYIQWDILHWLELNLFFDFNYDVLCDFFNTESCRKAPNYYFYNNQVNLLDYSLAIRYLKNRYSDKKILKLLTTVDNYRDFFEKLKLLNSLISKKIYPSLPKKAKKWVEIEIVISGLELKMGQGNFALNVEPVVSLDGEMVGDLVIVVPRTNYKLIKCAMLMKNCAGNGGYANEINQNKKSILFLEKQGKIKYCAEINPTGKVRLMNGVLNSTAPKIIVNELQLVLDQKYKKQGI